MNREKLQKASIGYNASRGGLNVAGIGKYLFEQGYIEERRSLTRRKLTEILAEHLNKNSTLNVKESKVSKKQKFSTEQPLQITGIDDIDIEILSQTPLDVIDRYCQRNQEVFEICKKERLWQKIGQQMGITTKSNSKSWRQTVEENRLRVNDAMITRWEKQNKFSPKSRQIIKDILDRFAGELSFVSFDPDSLFQFLRDYFLITTTEEKELKRRKRTFATWREGPYQTFVDIEWDLADWIVSRSVEIEQGQRNKKHFLTWLVGLIISNLYYSLEDLIENSRSNVIGEKEVITAINQDPEISFFFPLIE